MATLAANGSSKMNFGVYWGDLGEAAEDASDQKNAKVR